jgi:hypothetical protein
MMIESANETTGAEAIERARSERREALAALNATLPPGQSWRLYWDKEAHVQSVADAWTVGLIQAVPDPDGPDGWSTSRGIFVAVVSPIPGRLWEGAPMHFRFVVSYSNVTGGPLPFLEACSAAREASAEIARGVAGGRVRP